MKAVRLHITGIVQGVGFRPFVRRLAIQLKIPGWVRNTADGVCIVVPDDAAELLQQRLLVEPPRLARIDNIRSECCKEYLFGPFEIRPSTAGDVHTGVAPDASICTDCLNELNDPSDRRHRYPFLNCTNCGPRFSIVHGIPYDRSNTTMAAFELCPDCRSEYNDPSDRRYHAQPVACPRCGPQMWFEENSVYQERSRNEQHSLQQAIELIQAGGLLALRGIGGFHLACLACDEAAVATLRQRKSRPTKPLAIMVRDIDVARRYAMIDSSIEAQLTSAVAPIVLSPLNYPSNLASSVITGLGKVGIMLPYSPLHFLLLAAFDTPLVMTSGNHRGAPQITDNNTARDELVGMADGWLLHNREIQNRIDDSVVQITQSGTQVLRRARGLAPELINLPDGFAGHPDAIAFGADTKNAFALAKCGRAILSQHMGDLGDPRIADDALNNIDRLVDLFDVRPGLVMCDMHDSYQSSRLAQAYANALDLPIVRVQHHHAHAASLMIEQQLDTDTEIIALVQDGIGMGSDGEIWGAEALRVRYEHAERIATLLPAALPGGDAAAHEPWRNLVARLFDHYGPKEQWPQEYQTIVADFPVKTVCAAISAGINAPHASSAGRLFDAVAMALGFAPIRLSYEGEAAMQLEHAASNYINEHGAPEPVAFDSKTSKANVNLTVLDPFPIWDALLSDISSHTPACAAARFQLGWADGWAEIASNVDNETPIALSGGSFQNQLISKRIADNLQNAGRRVLQHSTVPPNDGGIALGQLAIGLAIHKSGN